MRLVGRHYLPMGYADIFSQISLSGGSDEVPIEEDTDIDGDAVTWDTEIEGLLVHSLVLM